MLPKRIRIKICCIANLEEAQMAVAYGADAVGLVSKMPSGPGVIPESEIKSIAARLPPPISRFLLTSERSVRNVVIQQELVRVDSIQLVDQWSLPDLKQLRESLPGIRVVQVVHVRDERSISEAACYSPFVDALLLDSGILKGDKKELGGTGRVHDWGISRKIVESSNIPVFLAGGLRPENIAEALTLVRPYGVDLCSGVRTKGRLDESQLRAFVAAVRAWEREQN